MGHHLPDHRQWCRASSYAGDAHVCGKFRFSRPTNAGRFFVEYRVHVATRCTATWVTWLVVNACTGALWPRQAWLLLRGRRKRKDNSDRPSQKRHPGLLITNGVENKSKRMLHAFRHFHKQLKKTTKRLRLHSCCPT